ncbi:thioredoxin family protein [Brevibacillus sp. GCM10020057]|uniref:thioredoxin family protein n=1 Tax=Brevibacillus sp. GCM10020057 TaxID=3317327 RepID=UPI003630FAC0
MMRIRLRSKWLWLTIVGSLLITVCMVWTWGTASASEKKIVYVYSDSCGYCQSFSPKLMKVLAEYPQHTVERLDIRQPRDLQLALRLGAAATPTVLIVEDEQVVDKLEGDAPAAALRLFFQKNLDHPLSGK